MAENIKARLRSASWSDPEASDDDLLTMGKDRLGKPELQWTLSSNPAQMENAGDVFSPVTAGEDGGQSGESTADLDTTVVAPTTVNTEDESTVASSDDETTPEQPRSRTTVEQMMVVDYQRRE